MIIWNKFLYPIIWIKTKPVLLSFLRLPLFIFKVFVACYLWLSFLAPLTEIIKSITCLCNQFFFTFRSKIADAVSDTILSLDKFEQGIRDCLEIWVQTTCSTFWSGRLILKMSFKYVLLALSIKCTFYIYTFLISYL